jgi:hypothetical protein
MAVTAPWHDKFWPAKCAREESRFNIGHLASDERDNANATAAQGCMKPSRDGSTNQHLDTPLARDIEHRRDVLSPHRKGHPHATPSR